MIYPKIVKGIFKARPNRFIAHVEIEGKLETVHVKNTGQCKELLIPGVTVILEDCRDNLNRKTKFDLIAVYKKDSFLEPLPCLINMDSQAPNKVVNEWLEKQNFDLIHPEYTYGDSRIDFYMEKGKEKFLMEVKGCTLEESGTGFFPDAPTERGVKHLRELKAAQEKGFSCIIAFVIQIPNVTQVFPNIKTHPEFGIALEEAKNAGVKVLCLPCSIEENQLYITAENYF